MKTKQIITILSILLFSISNYAQDKKVAVFTFYADKNIDFSNLSQTANLATKVTKLGDDPNFKLEQPLQLFYEEFYKTYVKKFPFKVLTTEKVTQNQLYKDLELNYEELGLGNTPETHSVVDDYKIILRKNSLIKQTLPIAKDLGVDGIMFVYLTFDFNKTGIGKFGYVSVRAKVHIDLYDKNGKSIFQFHEIAGSKKKAVLVGGIPVMTPSKILPMCTSAVESLMKDLAKKIGRISKKSDRKL